MAEAPSRRISTRSTIARGMALMFTASEGTPFSAIEIGCGAMRRPLRRA
jgi:hypothetical protein